MATESKRFTISLTPELEHRLDRAKQEKYYNRSQSQMVRDLILRGLNSFFQEQPCNNHLEQQNSEESDSDT